MRISKILLRNFRSISHEEIECESLTALVGRNGSGKSTLLRALELFFAPNPKFDPHDFYNEDISQEIEIELTFCDIRPEEETRFAKYIQNGTLTVIRILSLNEGKPTSTYHGRRLANPEFLPIRSAAKAADSKRLYEELRKAESYATLPSAATVDARLEAMSSWEEGNPGVCSMQRDEGQFFGFKEVGQGHLGRFTKFIAIPAVRDASVEAEEGRGSAITELIDLVVRSSLMNNKEIQELKESAAKRYGEIIDPAKLPEMRRLEGDLTVSLRTFVPDASIHLSWLSIGGIDIQMPKADVTLTEDGYRCPVTRTGHGLQRAFILTMLQYLAMANTPASIANQVPTASATSETNLTNKNTGNQDSPDIILSIEEPELYQHPTRQRHLATVLRHLAEGKSALSRVARMNQIIYSTHSPAFVGVDRFDQIRLFRKRVVGDRRPKVTKITNALLATIATQLWEYHGRNGNPYTAESLVTRLRALMTPWMNEGFFADLVVLVEGEEDRAAVLGAASALGHDLDSRGISVIPCGGKTNLDRPALIFDLLGIPVYIIWDSDYNGKDPKVEWNRCLLRIVQAEEQDYPGDVTHGYACFKTNLTGVMRTEIGDSLYDELTGGLRTQLGFHEQGGEIKNPQFVQALIESAGKRGKTPTSLEKVIAMILEKRDGVPGYSSAVTDPRVSS
jgi:putative ATP-dependent endonuclease of OLD family